MQKFLFIFHKRAGAAERPISAFTQGNRRYAKTSFLFFTRSPGLSKNIFSCFYEDTETKQRTILYFLCIEKQLELHNIQASLV